MKNLLALHEAVVVILLNKQDRTATFESIAEDIEKRNLFPERKGGITLAEQIKIENQLNPASINTGFTLRRRTLFD